MDAKTRGIFDASFAIPGAYKDQLELTEKKWKEQDGKVDSFFASHLPKAKRREIWSSQGKSIWPDMNLGVDFDWNYTHLVIHHPGDWGHKTPSSIEEMHLEGGAYADLAYHFLIDRNGEIYEGRSLTFKGSHVAGANSNKIGICFCKDLDHQWWDFRDEELSQKEKGCLRRAG